MSIQQHHRLGACFFLYAMVTGAMYSRLPDIQRLFYRSGNRYRPSVNAAAQWRPSSELEFYAEFLWQGFRNRIDDHFLEATLFGGQA